MNVIEKAETIQKLEKWARMKKNHISYTNGGSGVATTQKRVKLFITATVKAFKLHIFDRLHNSGGDSKCQFCEQTIGGASRLTSYDMDTSAPGGLSFAAVSAADLARSDGVDMKEWNASKKESLKTVAFDNSNRYQNNTHGFNCMGSILHCEVQPKPILDPFEYGPYITYNLDKLISLGYKNKKHPIAEAIDKHNEFMAIHELNQKGLRYAIDNNLCTIRGQTCDEHIDYNNEGNIGIMKAPTPKGFNIETGHFEYEDVSDKIVQNQQDIDAFSINIPSIVISQNINSNPAYWYENCWHLISHLHGAQPRWPNIAWPVDARNKFQNWLHTVGFKMEQIERHVVHLLHLKKTVLKLRSNQKTAVKDLLKDEKEFIVNNHLIITDPKNNETISVWYDKISQKLNLGVATVKLCVQEIVTCMLDEQNNSILDMDIEVKDGDGEVPVYCLCKQPFDEDRCYINCGQCPEAYHIECIGMSLQEYDEECDKIVQDWVCGRSEQCKQSDDTEIAMELID